MTATVSIFCFKLRKCAHRLTIFVDGRLPFPEIAFSLRVTRSGCDCGLGPLLSLMVALTFTRFLFVWDLISFPCALVSRPSRRNGKKKPGRRRFSSYTQFFVYTEYFLMISALLRRKQARVVGFSGLRGEFIRSSELHGPNESSDKHFHPVLHS